MADVVVTFDDGTSHTYQNAPADVTEMQVRDRVLQDFPQQAEKISRVTGAAPSGLGERLKSFATTGQIGPHGVLTGDLPQLALGAADTLTFGKTSSINPAQTQTEKDSRNAGRTIPAVLPTRYIPSLSGRSMVPPTPANLGRLLKAAQAAKAAQAPPAEAAAGAAKGINPAILRTLLHGAGMGAGPSALAYELYKHFFP